MKQTNKQNTTSIFALLPVDIKEKINGIVEENRKIDFWFDRHTTEYENKGVRCLLDFEGHNKKRVSYNDFFHDINNRLMNYVNEFNPSFMVGTLESKKKLKWEIINNITPKNASLDLYFPIQETYIGNGVEHRYLYWGRYDDVVRLSTIVSCFDGFKKLRYTTEEIYYKRLHPLIKQTKPTREETIKYMINEGLIKKNTY